MKKDSRLAIEERIPQPTLNLNSNRDFPTSEKVKILIDSKLFTFVASVATFGLYYLYYLFCIEQATESPFTKRDKTKRYEFEKSEEENEAWEESSRINRNLCDLIEHKQKGKTLESIKKESHGFLNKCWIYVSVGLNLFLNGIEKIVLKITRKEINLDLVEKYREKKAHDYAEKEEHMRVFINKKLKEKTEKKELEFEINRDLSYRKTKLRDYYLTFFFFFSYFLISLLTLGIFPVYHLIVRDRWGDFALINQHKEHAETNEFNNRIERLIGAEGKLEYSTLLLNDKKLPFSVSTISDAFRTRVFKSSSVRWKIVVFLTIVTFGLFGVFVLSKNVFDKEKLTIKKEDTKGTNYSTIKGSFRKFKFFLKDLLWDLNTASKFAAQKAANINESTKTLLKTRDKVISAFVRVLSSETYFWLFSFCFILGSLTLIVLFSAWGLFQTAAFLPWTLIIALVAFMLLFVKHIGLLFL